MTVGPFENTNDAYEAPNGVEMPPGLPLDAGARDPSSTTVSGSVANAMAYHAEHGADPVGLGNHVGDSINLPY